MAEKSLVTPQRNAAPEGEYAPLSTARKIILVNSTAAQTSATYIFKKKIRE